MLCELETKIWLSDFAVFKEKWLFCEGKAVKEFLHLEDLKLSRKDISCLISAHGEECNDFDSILQCLHDFYAKLYSKQDVPDDLDEFLAKSAYSEGTG